MFRWSRVKAFMIKEVQTTLADKQNRMLILVAPFLMLVLFAYTATMEVKNVFLLIYDKDNSQISKNLIKKFENTPVVKKVYQVNNRKEMVDLINRQKVYVAITIPQNFAKNIYNNNPTDIQIIMDGRKSNASQIASSYAQSIIQNFLANEINETGNSAPLIDIRTRNWFNPELNYQWFILISLTGMMAMSITLMITSLAIAQEKELGTFEQTIVSPLTSFEIIMGKTIPAIAISLMDTTFMVLTSCLFFKVPLSGSVIALYASLIVFLLAMAGIGLSISTLCKTQQQSILGVFTFMVPVLLLSGYMTPIENMPEFLQKFAVINPLTYFFILMKGIFLKNIDIIMILHGCIPLLLIALSTMTFSWWFFNKNLG